MGVESMSWSLVLIWTCVYMAGIYFLQACTLYLTSGNASVQSEILIKEYWSSLPTAMVSLYMAGTGGQDWHEIAKPLKEAGWYVYLMFLLYVAFFQFVVLNTLTSLFVESTLESTDRDQALIVQHEMEKKEKYVAKLEAL